MPRTKNIINKVPNNKAKCFICDNENLEKGVPLLPGQTAYSKTGLATKIGQLMGDRFMVIVSYNDMLCKRCSVLVNHLDKLETDIDIVRNALISYLLAKYQLSEEVDCQTSKLELEDKINEDLNHADTNNQNSTRINDFEYQEETYCCNFCNFKSTDSIEYYNHLQQCFNWTCHLCELSFKQESDYNNHIQTHETISKNEESKEFNNSENIEKKELNNCGICYKTFKDKLSLMAHAKSHNNVIYKCGICLEVFKDQNILIEHLKDHKKIDNNIKENIESENNSNFNENLNELIDETPIVNDLISNDQTNIIFHTCTICSISFLNESLFHDHMKIHDLSSIEFETKINYDSSITSLEINNIDNRKNFEIDSNRIESNLEQMLEGIHSDQVDLNIQENVNKETLEEVNHENIQHLETIQNLDTLLQTNNSQGFIKIQFLNQNNTLENNIESKTDSKKIPFPNIDSLNNSLETSQTEANFVNLSNNEINNTNFKEIFDLEKKNDDDTIINNISSIVNLCNVKVKSEVNHPSEDMEISMFICASCGYKTNQVNKLKLHFAEKHPEETNSLICSICSESFEYKDQLEEHILTHKQNFSQNPLKTNFPSDKLNCKICGLKFSNKILLKLHSQQHNEQFKCNECEMTFPKEKQLNDHQNNQHRDFHCKYCGKEIRQAKALRNHELRHEKASDIFECELCKRVFKTKTGLRHHIAVHTGVYKFMCTYCGRGFMSRMMMEEHLSKHTKEERYICDVCGIKFTFQSTYWIHRKWHDQPFPYKCDICNRKFRHSSLLAVHKRKHTGERPYKCPHCTLTFSVGGTLKRHMILHTGIYPFNCNNCKRGFASRQKYAQHLSKVHNDPTLLNSKTPKTEFKMVVRDNLPSKQEEIDNSNIMLEFSQGIEIQSCNDIQFKDEDIEDNKNLQSVENSMIPCTIITNTELLVEDQEPPVVEIVLDESQTVNNVNLEHNSLLPELWYTTED